jgi:hypothetical protein
MVRHVEESRDDSTELVEVREGAEESKYAVSRNCAVPLLRFFTVAALLFVARPLRYAPCKT